MSAYFLKHHRLFKGKQEDQKQKTDIENSSDEPK